MTARFRMGALMKTILCFGDSNTWGFIPASITEAFPRRHPRDIRWTGVMQRELGSEYHVVEEGQNGRTTVHEDPINMHRNGRTYLPACLESHKPIDLVVLMLGTNDLKVTYNLPAAEIAAGAAQLAKIILASESGPNAKAPKVLLVAPPDMGHMPHLPDIYEKLAGAQQKAARFPQCYEAVAKSLGCAFLNSQEFTTPSPVDGIHLEAQDHANLGKAIAASVRGIVQAQ
jgi:lysophospholipase L1-like esterase